MGKKKKKLSTADEWSRSSNKCAYFQRLIKVERNTFFFFFFLLGVWIPAVVFKFLPTCFIYNIKKKISEFNFSCWWQGRNNYAYNRLWALQGSDQRHPFPDLVVVTLCCHKPTEDVCRVSSHRSALTPSLGFLTDDLVIFHLGFIPRLQKRLLSVHVKSIFGLFWRGCGANVAHLFNNIRAPTRRSQSE